MFHVQGDGINEIFPSVFSLIKRNGIEEPSRNGRVVSLIEPLVVTNTNPRKRVLFCPNRHNNPFLDLFESLNSYRETSSAEYMNRRFGSRFLNFADGDPPRFHGHYGMRLHSSNQIDTIIERLKKNPFDRRTVAAIYWPGDLANPTSKDIPCNTELHFRISGGELDLNVINRSNDIFWGLCGVNTVQFSMMLESIANALSVPVGTLTHFTTNAHAYLDFGPYTRMLQDQDWGAACDYTAAEPMPIPQWDYLIEDVRTYFFREEKFSLHGDEFYSHFFNKTVVPMHEMWEQKDFSLAAANEIACPHWRNAVEIYVWRKQGL